MAIRNVDDLYNELSSNENFSGLFSSPEDLASSLQSMSPEKRDSFFEKMGASEQVSKVDFDNVLKKKDVSLSNLQLDGGDQGKGGNPPQPKPAVPSPIQPPRITLFPDEPAPGSPLKRKTIEERFPQTPEEKKRQQQREALQKVTEDLKKNKDVYTPPKKRTQEQVKQSIALQLEFEREQRAVSDMPVIQKIDWEAVARGEEFKKKSDEAAAQKKAAEVKGAKESTNSLFSGLQQGIYDYTIADGRKFQLDEYAIGRALFENEPIEVFSKTGNKVDILDPNRGILTGGEGNFNVIDDKSIRDHFTRLGLDETQTDEEILRLKQVYLQEGAKSASKSFYDQLLTKWNGNEALANQNYLAYWNNRGLDLLEGAEKEAYHIVRQMEGLRSQLIKEQKKGGLSNYSSANIASFRKQLDDYQDQLSELRDNPNNLYDWRTGEFIDARIRKSDPRVAEIQQENKEFQAKYGDKPKEVLVKRRDELLAQRAFIMGKMKQFNLDIPEEGTWDAAVRALQISAARTAGTNQIVLPDGRSVSSIDYKRKMDDYNSQLYSVMSELYGLNRSVMLNENVALRKESESFLGSIAKNIGIATESVVREFAPGASTQDANSEFNRRNSVLNALEQSGYVVSPSLRSDASASVSETISGSAGMLVSSMLQIAVGNIAVPEVMALRWAKGFKDLLTNKYGKIGGAVFEQTANAMRSGLIFQAAGQGFSTGVGEAGAQAAFDALDLDKLLGSKGRLANFLYRSLIGGAGEFTEEVAGQYIQGLTDAGFDPNKAFKESFGVSPESRLDQLLVIGITSLGFSGASNLKILTASQSTLNQILEDPKLAAAYGDVLTPEKRQQIEEVLKAVDDKLADKQSRQTNASVTAAESSEYTPRVDAAESEKQVSIFNEERKKALEQLAVEDGPQSEEQKAELEQKATEINNYYDEQIRSVVPPQTKFDTFTGTNQNAVLGNSDLNSEQTQNFLASLPNERARRNAATLIAVGNNSNNTLSSVLPNAKIVMHSRESFRDKMSQLGEEANRKGNFAVIRNKDGSNQIEIQINVEDGAVIDIAHEVTHGVLYSKFYGDDKRMAEVAVINANKELSEEDKQAQIEQVNQTYDSKFSETLGEFKNQLEALVNEKGNTYLKNFISNYEDNAKNEEYLTELIAILVKNGEQIEQEDPTFFVRLLALLNKLVGVIGKEAGIKLQKFDDTQEVIDFFNTIASSIRKGEALNETNLRKKDAVQEQTAGQVPVQSEASVGQEVGQGKPQAELKSTTQNKARKDLINQFEESNLKKKGVNSNIPLGEIKLEEDEVQAAESNLSRGLYSITPDEAVEVAMDIDSGKMELLDGYHRVLAQVGETQDALERANPKMPINAKVKFIKRTKTPQGFDTFRDATEAEIADSYIGGQNQKLNNLIDDNFDTKKLLKFQGATQNKARKEAVTNIQTGVPVTIEYNKNPEKAPIMGKTFGQDIEPAGNYVTQNEGFTPQGWKSGRVTLNSPLVIDITPETQISYKRDLSKKFGNKKGAELSNEIVKQGYDSIVTKYADGSTGEIVLLANQIETKPQVTPQEGKKEVASKPRVSPLMKQVFHGGDLQSPGNNLYVATDRRQADAYAQGNQGKVFKFFVDKNSLAPEDLVRQTIVDLGLQPREEGWKQDELGIHELLDNRFDTSLLDEQIAQLQDKLKSEGYTGVAFIDEDILQKNKAGVENYLIFNPKDLYKSEQEGINKLTPEQPNVVSKARRDSEAVRKDLDKKLASGAIDDVTLSLLEEYAEQIEGGTAVFERFSSSEHTGIIRGSRALAEAVLLVGRNVEADETQDERNERQEQEVEEYARERGIWVDNTLKTFNGLYGERLGSGQEAIVWRKDDNTVIKSSNTLQYEDLQLFLDRLVLHNTLFPASAQKLVGFGSDSNGDFEVIIEQPYIPESEEATTQEIKEYLAKLGFEQYLGFGGGERFKTNEVLLNDAAPRNFVKTENGKIIPIDLILKINLAQYGFGGTRVLAGTQISTEAIQENTDKIIDVRSKARKIDFDKNTGDISVNNKKVDVPTEVANSSNSIPNALDFASASSIPTNLEFKRAMQDRFQSYLPELKKKYGENFDPQKENDALKSYLVDAYTYETMIAMKSFPDALGWYDAKTKAAMEVMSLVHPEIATDPIAAGIFKIAVAVTSNGNKVTDNFIEADRQYNYFKDNGKFDEAKSIGTQSSGIKSTFNLTNEILKTLTKEQFIKFLTSKFRAGDLKYTKKSGKSTPLLTGFTVDTQVFGASIFGPKIGNGFFMNLYGDFTQLTMDRWFMRQYGRLTGTLIKVDPKKVKEGTDRIKSSLKSLGAKEKAILNDLIPNYAALAPDKLAEKIAKVSGKVDKREVLQANTKLDEVRKAGNSLDKNIKGEIEAPGGGKQRAFIISVFDEVQKRLKDEFDLDITIADLQAVNWYPEKALYQTFQAGKTEELGAEETSDNEQPDYESAAKKLAKNYGFNEKQINDKLNNEDGTRKFDTGGNQEFGRNHSDIGVELAKKQILDVKTNLEKNKVKSKARLEAWSTPQQEISSAGTSINKAKLPSVYSDKKFLDLLKGVPGKRIVIADIGSGKYANVNIKPLLERGEIAEFINDSSKKMLGEKALPALEEVLGGKEIAYHPYDPFNQPASVNEETISTVRDGGADIAVSPNVLNVIAEAEAREGVIFNMANAVGTTGTAVIQIYEGDPKDRGVGKETKTAGEASWQNNQQTAWYLPEVQAYFANVKRSGNIIIADNKGQMSLFGQPAVVNGAQKAQIQSKARIEDRVKQSKGYGVPQRYKGDVGKMIGGDLYVHSSANDVLPQKELIAAEAKLPEDFEYEVIKYNAADGSFSFIASPDWNTSSEPIVGDAYKVKKSGEVTVTKQKSDPQIYHHKWNFVRDGYSGFDVEQSVQRSIDWYRDAKADINMFKIGTQSYWKENATPLITDTTKIISKARVDRVDFAIVKDYNDFRNAGFSVDGAYFELEKMNYSPGDIKRYIPEIGENWKKRSVNKFFATIRKHRGKITKRQGEIRQELENNPGLEFDSLYTLLKDKFEDFELYKAFYEEGANPALLDEIFGTEYRQTIQKAMDETRSGRTVYNRDFLREIKDDARSRKMVNLANQMNSLFGFTNGIIDNQQMIEMMADGLEETGLEFSLRAVTDDIRTKRAELEADLNVLKKIGRAQVDPKDMINVSRLLSLAGRMLRMGRGLFKNQELFEKAIFDSIENVSYKTEAGNIIRKFKGFKLTNGQKEKIRKAITEFRTAKAEYETEIKALEESEDAYTDSQYEAFDKSKIKFDQAARKLKTTIDAFKKKSTGNWFTSMTALALLSVRTILIGGIGNLELMLANTPKKGKFLVLGWSRALANKLVTAFTRRSVTELNSMIKRGASGNIDPELYRKMAWEQGVQQIKNIFENTVASASNSENAFFEGQNTIDSTRELPTGIKMIGVLMKNIFKKDFDKVSDQEWAEQFDQLLVLLNEKDENGNNKLELMNPKGYQATTTLLRGIFGYIPSAVGKSIALSGDRVFYQYGYYEALASYAYAQGITDPAEVKKFIRLNSVPNATAGDVARKEGERRIFANDNVITDAFTKARGNIAKTEKNLYAKSVKLKKEGKYLQRFVDIYPAKLGLATTKMGMTILSPFTRIPSNFVGTAIEKTVAPYTIASYWFAQRKLNRLVKEYDNLFNVDENETLSATKQKEQERLRNAIFEQQRVAGRKLVSTFQALQVAAVAYLLWQSGAVGAPYGDDEEEKKAARAAGLAGQPPGKINVTALVDYVTNGFDNKGRTYQKGDFTFNYTNLGIFGFGMTWFATMHGSLAAKEFEDRKVMGVGEDGYSNVSFNMVAESITNGITGLSFIQNISALVSAVKTKDEGLQNFAVNLAKTALTVPSMAYGIFGAVEKAEGISADSMRNYFPDLEADDSIGSKFKMKLWTSMTGKSPITLFGLRNTKGEFLSPFASPYYQPQIGPHGEELYKKNTFWDVRSGELSDRVAAYLQASFDPFSMSTYEGFVSTIKKYDAKQTYYPGDIVDDGEFVYAIKKEIPPGADLNKLNLDQQDKDYETITETKDFFDKDKYVLNKRGSEATTQLYDLLALYQKSTGSRKEFALLSKYYTPFVQGKDAEGEFGVYIPLKYQRQLAKLRGDAILNSYDQNQIKEAIDRIQKNADDMSDEEFNPYVESQVEDLLMGPVNAVTLARSGGIASKMNTAIEQVENSEVYRVIKTKAIHEALEAGLFTEEQYLRIANAEGTNEIVAEFDKSKLKFKK